MRPSILHLVPLAFLLSTLSFSQGKTIGFQEQFALASDRAAALERLVPGTEDFYYYHCLQHQNVGEFDSVEPLLKTWIKRHGRGRRVAEIENRQALLTFTLDPGAGFAYLIRKLNLRFDHKRQVAGQAPALPDQLAPERISDRTLSKRAHQLHRNSLAGFEDSMLGRLASTKLTDQQLTELLQRLRRPDVANLPALIVRQLEIKASRGFGSLAIHKALLLNQLEACASLRPNLLNDPEFVSAYLTRLKPSADVDWRDDPAERQAYLDRLWNFARRLAPAHNALKAHILRHRLVHGLLIDELDRDSLLEYLRLPRRTSYVNPSLLKSRRGEEIVNKASDEPSFLGASGDDEPLVRTYLEHFFRTDSTWEGFGEYVRPDYLRRVFAETKILYGLGDMERWYSLLDDPGYYEQLERRVEIEFPMRRQTRFAADEAVSLEVDTKNVDTLLIKVFEIDALAYALAEGHEVDASINLDGLVAGAERTLTYDDHPLRRVRRQFDFPSLSRPGVYVVDFIGGGLSSRALIHKGRLRLRERHGSAGHVFQVLDESGRALSDAAVYVEGRRYEAGKRAEILVPYTAQAEQETIVLQSGRLVAVESFLHLQETYALSAGVYVDRESIMEGGRAKILVRPELLVSGAGADIGLLENPVLTLTAFILAGTRTSVDVRDIELKQDRELVHEFQVPRDVTRLLVTLSGEVENLTLGKRETVASRTHDFVLNGIDATAQVDCPLLGRDEAGYFLDVLGKNGEPRVGHVVTFDLVHKGFRDSLSVQLKTNDKGRVRLGELSGVTALKATGLPEGSGSWHLTSNRRSAASRLHGREGEVLRMPYSGDARSVTRAEISLLELRDGEFVRDRTANVALVAGFLELKDLPAGDYDLLLKQTGRRVNVQVTQGEIQDGWAVGRYRALELGRPDVQLIRTTLDDGGLEIELANASPDTRVHVFSTRFVPAFDAYKGLGTSAPPELREAAVSRMPATFHSGRQIGEEYRYILERRYAKKYPGNMLARPGLLLNPWALGDTSTSIGMGGGAGGKFGGRRGGGRGSELSARVESGMPLGQGPGTFPNLNFLPSASAVLANLRPGHDGVLRVPAERLGDGQQVRILVVDGTTLLEASVQRSRQGLAPQDARRDRRLARGLDPQRHFSERRRIDFLTVGESATIHDTSRADAQTYDTLADVFQLYRTLRPDSDLEGFAFLLQWPQSSEQEKRELYSKFACHELHVFLYHKDRDFFGSVVRPYIANKADKTFIDRWLLGEDLKPYLESRAFGRLNVFERILLGQRFAGVRGSIARLIRERVEISPTSPEELDALYDMTLAGAELTLQEKGKATSGGIVYKGPGDAARPAAPAPAEGEPSKDAEDLLAFGEVRARREQAYDKDDRSRVRSLFIRLGITEQYVEHNYWHRSIEEQGAGLIEANAFWLDLAEADPGQPFLSEHFAQASANEAEMLMALSVLDLPFSALEHASTQADGDLTLRAGSPLLLVRKELSPAEPAEGSTSLLVGQQFYRLDDRYQFDGGRRKERLDQDEFIQGVPYGCRVVVTNPSADPLQLELLLQIPAGSMPLSEGFSTRGIPVRLGPYATHAVEYAFYFPVAGSWGHYPAHATHQGKLLASAPALTMNVVAQPTTVDKSSWEYVSQHATLEDLLTHMGEANLQRVDLERLAWRMQDRTSFEKIRALLSRRHIFNDTLWSYGLRHLDYGATKAYLRHADGFLSRCGPWLDTPVVIIDPIERLAYQRVEFTPLINARAHPMGQGREILNQNLARQYSALLNILAHKPALDDTDWMSVTYHLLLQDRTEEALASFARVDPAGLPMRVQYDYMQAYMDFFSEQHTLARGIASAYLDHPVSRWRDRFRQVVAYLDEAEGRVSQARPDERVETRNDALAAEEPTLEISVEAGRLELRHNHLDACEVRYYVMDVEFLFSTSPFVQQGSGSFSYVKPNRIDSLTLSPEDELTRFDLPQQFLSANVLVEVRADGLVRRQAYYANTLAVQTMENYGQIKVTHAETGRPLPRVYVKVFSKDGDKVVFHKDGYTDLRGRFEYVSVSGGERSAIDRFAILVLSEENGAVIRELQPPGD